MSSNEPANGRGDGNTDDDWQITAPLTVELRAGVRTGRTYTITVECADAGSNTARTEVQVTVAHNQGGLRA